MTRRLLILLLAYLTIVGVAGVIFEVAEGRGLAESLWWAIVTATTVGYGDLSPVTPVGRVVAAVLMHLTILCVLPLLSAEIAAKLIVDHDALTHDEQEEIKGRLRRIEAMVEQLAHPVYILSPDPVGPPAAPDASKVVSEHVHPHVPAPLEPDPVQRLRVQPSPVTASAEYQERHLAPG